MQLGTCLVVVCLCVVFAPFSSSCYIEAVGLPRAMPGKVSRRRRQGGQAGIDLQLGSEFAPSIWMRLLVCWSAQFFDPTRNWLRPEQLAGSGCGCSADVHQS